MLMDREPHKANCVSPLRTLEILLSRICQGCFHRREWRSRWAVSEIPGYTWEVKGCCREPRAAASACQSLSNLSRSPDNARPLLASVNPSNAAPLRKRRPNRLPALLHAASLFVFPLPRRTGARQHRQNRQPW